MALPSPLGSTPIGLGDMLAVQAANETDEQRRKRLLEMQSRAQAPQPLSASMGMTRANALSSAYSGAY